MSKLRMPISLEIYEKIKYDILENHLKPGEKLVEEDLAKELDVSRTPVREALKQLDQDGLVTYYPRKGSVVSQMSIKDALEIYEVREVLEGLAIKSICLNINEDDIKKLENIIFRMDKAINTDDYRSMSILHKQWTETILSLIKNDLLKGYLTTITENLGRLRKISLYKSEHSLDAYRETKEIFYAIVNKDPDKGEKLAKLHVRNAKRRYEQNIELRNI